jgi:hypothetical protein
LTTIDYRDALRFQEVQLFFESFAHVATGVTIPIRRSQIYQPIFLN